jgi:outer membrane murein-binding lipoprotein Lpp
MKKHIVTIAAALSVGLIAGCGGGGSTQATSTSVSGAVADGYLAGATVFLDKNGNYMWDEGEPKTVTDANGAYTLTVDPADVGKYPIVALAVKGVTTDSDTGLLLNSYLLSMPKESVSGTVSSNFISPMSTQIRELMATGKYTKDQAMDQMRTQLKLPAGTDMLADYMINPGSANSQAMHSAAQNMASLMGSQMSQVLSSSGSTPTVDVNRYRGMMGAIFSNMSTIKGPGSSTDTKTAMTNLMGTMTANLPSIVQGQPYRNMSSFFKPGMGSTMGGTRNPGMGM